MVKAIGSDLVEIPRLAAVIQNRGQRFLDRIYTEGEKKYCERRKMTSHQSYASRFAAKEAVMKALGTGWSKGVRWVDIEVVRHPGEAPQIVLHKRCAEIAREKDISRFHLSLTHTEEIAAAFVVAE